MNYTIRQWLNEAQEQLEQCGKPSREARYMIEYVLHIPLSQLLLEYNRTIESEEIVLLNAFLQKRIEGIPFQQITHEQVFMGHTFYVNEHVLIPRPETEQLVELVEAIVIDNMDKKAEQYAVLDMCTGSGCILISLKAMFNDSHKSSLNWYGSDISEEAIYVAKLNEKHITNEESIRWYVGSLFDPLPEPLRYDVIVSNPPYIPLSDMESLMQEVREYEPTMALTDGQDGLSFYRKIAMEGFKRLKNGGFMAFEIGHGQMKEVIDIMITAGYIEVVGHHDYAGLERQVIGKKPIIPD